MLKDTEMDKWPKRKTPVYNSHSRHFEPSHFEKPQFLKGPLCSLEPNWLAIEASRLYRNECQVWIIEWKGKKGLCIIRLRRIIWQIQHKLFFTG